MTNLVSQLIRVAEGYATARSLSMSRVSTLAFGDGKMLSRLTAGADLTTRRHEAAMMWFSQNWPQGAEWPADVSRPASGDAAR